MRAGIAQSDGSTSKDPAVRWLLPVPGLPTQIPIGWLLVLPWLSLAEAASAVPGQPCRAKFQLCIRVDPRLSVLSRRRASCPLSKSWVVKMLTNYIGT